ncbi:dephospho-CoA kinase [Halalkalibacterium halodurans]|uniref:dephospho-CoA kinase n=1 Tax=Halalkalibacterium halodurans TaxID=86665 RepID=UPI002E228F6A|nr:dephospho-CoA kinase [Halalkalibacterium halodurans]MED4164592.1 dephospho-CoA kinase [Halalkalibacterium halodurans]
MMIGLTGGIASGKSSVAKMMEELGLPIVDADKVARDVVEPGMPAYEAIVTHFGTGVVNDDGTLNRKALGSIVFQQEEERRVLNEIVHPAVRRQMQQQKEQLIRSGEKTIVFDIPLLYESNLFYLVEKVLLVYVDEHTQLQRLMNRDQAGKDDAIHRIRSQRPLESKRDRADAIIDNSGTLDATKRQLIDILKRWKVIPEDQ